VSLLWTGIEAKGRHESYWGIPLGRGRNSFNFCPIIVALRRFLAAAVGRPAGHKTTRRDACEVTYQASKFDAERDK